MIDAVLYFLKKNGKKMSVPAQDSARVFPNISNLYVVGWNHPWLQVANSLGL